MKILIMNRKYDNVFGGVEYMSTSLANEMARRGHKCHLLSLDSQNASMHYDLDSTIQWHKISDFPTEKKASWKERLSRLKQIRQIVKNEKVDILIGFQDGCYLSLMVATLGLGVPVIAAERNSPSRFDYIKAGKFKFIQFNAFRMADTITVQCPSYVKKYPSYLEKKMRVIPNPIKPVGTSKAEKKNIVLSVGRLAFQKNMDVLVKAFARLAPDFPDWKLVIVGDGEDMAKLKNLVADLKTTERVELSGYAKNPAKYYEEASIFCLPSRWEGFPNALAEAMSYALPCVGFEKCCGVSDLIDDMKTGVLASGIDDDGALAEALKTLMSNSDIRKELGEASRNKSGEYTPNKVYDMWEQLFLTMTRS